MFYKERIILFICLTTSMNIACSSVTTLNSTKVALWLDSPIPADLKLALDSLVAKLNSRFDVSLTVEVVPLKYSANKVNDVLHLLKNYSRDKQTVVVTALSVKETWFWSTLLCQRYSTIIDIRNPGPSVEIENEVSNDLMNSGWSGVKWGEVGQMHG